VLVARHHGVVHRAFELRPGTVLDLLESSDALRRPERFEAFLLACEADARGRTGLENREYTQADYLRSALSAVRSCVPSAEDIATQAGADIAARLREQRLKALNALRPPAE
jgi:tRNA nucleotidyltransferase (CCA-adding enzyme)